MLNKNIIHFKNTQEIITILYLVLLLLGATLLEFAYKVPILSNKTVCMYIGTYVVNKTFGVAHGKVEIIVIERKPIHSSHFVNSFIPNAKLIFFSLFLQKSFWLIVN